jgi:hypothetical protein
MLVWAKSVWVGYYRFKKFNRDEGTWRGLLTAKQGKSGLKLSLKLQLTIVNILHASVAILSCAATAPAPVHYATAQHVWAPCGSSLNASSRKIQRSCLYTLRKLYAYWNRYRQTDGQIEKTNGYDLLHMAGALMLRCQSHFSHPNSL